MRHGRPRRAHAPRHRREPMPPLATRHDMPLYALVLFGAMWAVDAVISTVARWIDEVRGR